MSWRRLNLIGCRPSRKGDELRKSAVDQFEYLESRVGSAPFGGSVFGWVSNRRLELEEG
jgi:hypothetical protein